MKAINIWFKLAIAIVGALLLVCVSSVHPGASTVQAATVETSDDGTNATGIRNFKFNGTVYNVVFLRTTGDELYFPSDFDFTTVDTANAAVNAVNDVLNTEKTVKTVGQPSKAKTDFFNIGFAFDEGATEFAKSEYMVGLLLLI